MPSLGPALIACFSLAFVLGTARADDAGSLTLPLQVEGGLPLVDARIDGRAARLLLDTGGAAALALRVDWGPAGAASAAVTQDAQGQQRINAALPVGEVVLAGQSLVPVPAAQTWAKARRPAGVDGYLGWGWLRERRWMLDYAAGRLQLFDPQAALPAACGTAPQPFRLLGSLPVVQLRAADGQVLTLGLDTGATRNVIRPAAAAAVAGPLALDGQVLAVGGFVTVPLQVPGLDGFLGQDFFSRHRVCMAPAARQLWVQPLAP